MTDIRWPKRKITIPRSSDTVARGRIATRIEQAMQAGRVELILAPGGSGKTVAAAHWAAATNLPVIWYAISSTDRDLHMLLGGLAAATEVALPGQAARVRRSLAFGVPIDQAVEAWLADLEDLPAALVLDDLHHLDGVAGVGTFVEALMRLKPPSLGITLLSRSVPLLGFSALAELDVLSGLGQTDLRFRADETAALLANRHLDPTLAATLTRMTGGWPTGILLLARTGQTSLRFVNTPASRLLERLAGEIVDGLAPDLVHFLLRAAVVCPIDKIGAAEILNEPECAQLLTDLLARGLFLDEHDGIFQFHDLFSDYLATRLRRDDADEYERLCQRVAAYCERQGDLGRAAETLLRLQDARGLAALLERHAASLWRTGRWSVLTTYGSKVDTVVCSVGLVVLIGSSFVQQGRYREGLAMAEALDRHPERQQPGRSLTSLRAAYLRGCALEGQGEHDHAAAVFTEAIAAATVAEDQEMVMRLADRAAVNDIRAGRPGGFGALEQVLSWYDANDSTAPAVVAAINLAMFSAEAGLARMAEPLVERMGVYYHQTDNQPQLATVGYIRALLAGLQGDAAGGAVLAEEAAALARAYGQGQTESTALAAAAQLRLDAGFTASAAAHAQAAADLAARIEIPHLLSTALRAQIQVALTNSDTTTAQRLLDYAADYAHTPRERAQLAYTMAQLQWRQYGAGVARDPLVAAADALEASGRPGEAARALLLAAEATLAAKTVALRSRTIRRAEELLGRLALLVEQVGCAGTLRPLATQTMEVGRRFRQLRRLSVAARSLAESLYATPAVPPLHVVENTTTASAQNPMLWLSPFGQGCIRVHGETEIPLTSISAKAAEVLFFVADSGGSVDRGVLLNTVFGEDERDTRLHNCSRDLRRALGPGVWVRQVNQYHIAGSWVSAAIEFRTALTHARAAGSLVEQIDGAERALALAPGPFLPQCESDWAIARRATLDEQRIEAALFACHLYASLNRPEDAIDAARTGCSVDPYAEAPQRALIEVLLAIQHSDEALAVYRDYCTLLASELQARPSASLQRLLATRDE